jgi:hypothetical protein
MATIGSGFNLRGEDRKAYLAARKDKVQVWMEIRFLKQWTALREKLLEKEKASGVKEKTVVAIVREPRNCSNQYIQLEQPPIEPSKPTLNNETGEKN